jgi:hypothetical protein
VSEFWLYFGAGVALGLFIGWTTAKIAVKFDRARRGWNRKT